MGLLPGSVGVYTREFSPRVSVNDSIGVDHGHDLENVVI